MVDTQTTARFAILILIGHGNIIIGERNRVLRPPNTSWERLNREAMGYRDAAATLLNAFPALHNELIEHPDFVRLRNSLRVVVDAPAQERGFG